MPYLISELLPSLTKPVTANADEPIFDALTRMLQHGYSQLPVVKGSGQSAQFYLLTSNNVLEKLKFYGLPPDGKGLKVDQAMVKVPRVFTPDDTITEIMDGLKQMDAVLIVDEQRELKHVVTIYDMTHFFRQWSEDLLNAREVELALRKIIEGAFKRSDGTIDEEARKKAIDGAGSEDGDLSGKGGYRRFNDAVKSYLAQQQASSGVKLDRNKAYEAYRILTASSQPPVQSVAAITSEASTPATLSTAVANDQISDRRERFEAALQYYLESTQASSAPNEDWIRNAYRQHLQAKQEPQPFHKLSLGAYINLFFHDKCWGRCGDVFGFDQDVVKRILKGVQEARNLLAHFREEDITDEHRSTLRQAAEWLPEYQRKAVAKLDATAPEPPVAPEDISLRGALTSPELSS